MYGISAEKLYEFGISTIPVKSKGEFGIFTKWQKFCSEKASLEEIRKWAKQFPDYNIGLPLGPANGLVAIDIDTDEQFVMEFLPKSQFVKKGKTGETRFFRYTNSFVKRNVKDGSGAMLVQALGEGQQTIIPPSVHPENKNPYKWTLGGVERLVEEVSVLPDNFNEILNYLEERYASVNEDKMLRANGRHDKLLSIGVAMAHAGYTDSQILAKVTEYDENRFEKSWFYEEQTPEYFMKSIRKMKTIPPNPERTKLEEASSDKHQANDKESLEIIEIQSLGDELKQVTQSQIPYEPIPIPKGGLLQPLYEQIQALSGDDITPLAVASAEAILSLIMGRRFFTYRPRINDVKLNRINVWPRGYFVCIAPSGWGKSHGPNFINEHLSPNIKDFSSNVHIQGGFGSGHGVVHELKANPICLSKIEEISALFRLANDGIKNKDNIAEILCDTWSSASSYIQLGATKESKQKGDVIAQNPALTILGFTTATAFSTSVTEELNKIGLIPRFNIYDCVDWEEKDENLQQHDEKKIEFLVKSIGHIVNDVKIFTGAEYNDRAMRDQNEPLGLSFKDSAVVPHRIGLSEELARDVLSPIHVWSRELGKQLGDDHCCVPYLNRCAEQVMISAQRHCVSRFEWSEDTEVWFTDAKYPTKDILNIEEQDIQYGFKSFKSSLYALDKHSNSLAQEGEYSRTEDKVLKILGEVGPDGILVGRLGRLVRSEKRPKVVWNLRELGQAVQFKNGQRKYLVLSSHARKFKELNALFTIDKTK